MTQVKSKWLPTLRFNLDFKEPQSQSLALLIKHLPDAIPHVTLSRLLSHYGASSVRPGSGERRLKVLGKVLSAEKACKPIANEEKSSTAQLGKDSKTPAVKNGNVTKLIDGDTKSGGLTIPEPIAHRLGVDYPFPPHLEYAYPPLDGNILTNIENALIVVPSFYTQILYLMNKMNIPLPTPPLPPGVPAPPVPPPHSVNEEPQSADMSSDESEMGSSDEEDGARTDNSGRRCGPAIDKDVAHESVGVKPVSLNPKEILMIKKNPILKIKIAPKAKLNEHKDNDTRPELQEPDKRL